MAFVFLRVGDGAGAAVDVLAAVVFGFVTLFVAVADEAVPLFVRGKGEGGACADAVVFAAVLAE